MAMEDARIAGLRINSVAKIIGLEIAPQHFGYMRKGHMLGPLQQNPEHCFFPRLYTELNFIYCFPRLNIERTIHGNLANLANELRKKIF